LIGSLINAPLARQRPAAEHAARAGRLVSRLAVAGFAGLLITVLGGCALLTPPQTRGLREAPPPDLAAPVELADVPFFAQTDHECGPAALATALGAAGLPVQPEALTAQVYLPARQGSLQAEMLATARRRGALAVRLPPTLPSLLRELNAGHPVVVLQNLGLSFAPRWHYAVLIGHDLAARELLLRSGTTRREVMGLSTFEHTWARGGHWAFVALAPGQLPATASETELTAATVAFERAAPPAAAQQAYDAALGRWPDNLTLAIGAGNTRAAAGDLAGAALQFEAAARRHDSAAAWINLAEVRLQLLQLPAAEAAARHAVAASQADPAWRDAALQSLARITAAANR
jgi:hypothetical protein